MQEVKIRQLIEELQKVGRFVQGGRNGMWCFVRVGKSGMGWLKRYGIFCPGWQKWHIGCFVWGGQSLWDVLSRVSKMAWDVFSRDTLSYILFMLKIQTKIESEYDQALSQTAGNLKAPRGRATQLSRDNRRQTKQSNQLSSSSR